ncbi:MAG: hypothetical protein R3F44_00040 [Candidatus Competibacteraceae bacterium]
MAVTNNKLIGAVGLAVLSVVLAWRILVTGLAEYYVGRDTPEADAGALRWRSDQSAALYRQSLALAGRDPAAAMRLYQAAAWANPTDALVFLALASASGPRPAVGCDRAGGNSRCIGADAYAGAGPFGGILVGSGPTGSGVGALGHVTAEPAGTAGQLYPLLLRWVENAEARPLLRSLLADPPVSGTNSSPMSRPRRYAGSGGSTSVSKSRALQVENHGAAEQRRSLSGAVVAGRAFGWRPIWLG